MVDESPWAEAAAEHHGYERHAASVQWWHIGGHNTKLRVSTYRALDAASAVDNVDVVEDDEVQLKARPEAMYDCHAFHTLDPFKSWALSWWIALGTDRRVAAL